MDPTDRENRVRQRAHEIWEHEGRTDGQEQEHWARAERDIQQQDDKLGSEQQQSGGDGLPSGLQPGGTVPGGSPATMTRSLGIDGGSTGKPAPRRARR